MGVTDMYTIKTEYFQEQFHTTGNVKNKAYQGKSLTVSERYSGKASKNQI